MHLIADEIAVGFGRTGTMFACEQASIRPDFMCLSKGLTGGYLPMSVVLTTDDVYAAFYDEYAKLNAFLHSHSYSGNPLACAAALATLDIFAEGRRAGAQPGAGGEVGSRRAARRSSERRRGPPARHDRRHRVRRATAPPASAFPWRERRHLRIHRHALERGVLLRPIGNVIYFMPPYVDHDDGDRSDGRGGARGPRARGAGLSMREIRVFYRDRWQRGSAACRGAAQHVAACCGSRPATR